MCQNSTVQDRAKFAFLTMLTRFLITAFAFAMLSFGGAASAHHAMEVHYLVEDEEVINKQGVVKNFSLLDPHSYLVVTVEEEGESTDWVLEGRSRVTLTRAGWRFDMLTAGTPISFSAFPARSGVAAGRILSIEVAGELYCSDRCELFDIEPVEVSSLTESLQSQFARDFAGSP